MLHKELGFRNVMNANESECLFEKNFLGKFSEG